MTVLKQRCRELGVVRWPFRKVKKIDTLIKQLEEEKERLLLLSAAKNNENESNIDDNNRHCLFLLEDIEKRLVDARKMREELYLDPNSNVHLVAAAMKPTMSASNCGGTSNNNNENTSNSNDIKKQAKQNRGLFKRFFANKKSLSKKTLPTTTTTTISGKDEDSDSGELITNNNNTVINAPIIIPQQQQQQQQELVRKSLGVPCKYNSFKRRSVELTRNSVELTRQSSGDKGGQLFDALLDAASALDDDDEPVKLKGITSKDIRTPRTSSENEKDEDYQWGRKSSNDDDEKDNADDNNGALGSPRKARRSCDILQHSIRPPSLDLGNQARPTSEPANIEACGGTSNNNNENTSNSNDIKKQAKQNRGLFKRFFANKKSLSKKTLPTTTTTTISGKDEDSDSGELITNNNNTVINAPIIIPQQQQQQQQELVRKSLGVPCKYNSFKRRSVELTRNSVELTRQSSGDKGGQLFDALLDAASALDDDDEPVKLKGITSKDIRTPRTSSENEKDEDYQWGRKSSNDDDEKDNADDNNGALGSPRKARRSCDILQHSIRPPSLDLGNQARPTSEPANIEAELRRLYHQHAQNAATYQAMQQALLAQHSAFMMNPHHMAMNMPMMYQTPQQSFQYMQLNAQLMQMQWGYAVNNGGGGMATTSDVAINGKTAQMSLLERRAFEAASVPSSLNLNLQPLGGEKSLVEPPTSDDDDESSGNEGDDDNKSAVGTPKSTNSFPPSARSSFDIPSPSVQILHGGAGVGLHKPLAARAGFVPVNKKM